MTDTAHRYDESYPPELWGGGAPGGGLRLTSVTPATTIMGVPVDLTFHGAGFTASTVFAYDDGASGGGTLAVGDPEAALELVNATTIALDSVVAGMLGLFAGAVVWSFVASDGGPDTAPPVLFTVTGAGADDEPPADDEPEPCPADDEQLEDDEPELELAPDELDDDELEDDTRG